MWCTVEGDNPILLRSCYLRTRKPTELGYELWVDDIFLTEGAFAPTYEMRRSESQWCPDLECELADATIPVQQDAGIP